MRELLAGLIGEGREGMRNFELLAGGALSCALVVVVLLLPTKMVVPAIVGILAALYFFSKPATSLMLIFVARVLVDLVWWLPMNVGGLNVLEAFGGAVAGLAAVLFYIELRKVERQPGFVPLLVYLGVMAVAVVRTLSLRDAAEIMAKYVSPLLLMFLVSTYMDTERRRRAFLGLITAAGVLSLFVSAYHLATGQRFTYFLQGYYRLLGGYSNLHNHALFLLVLATLLFFWSSVVQHRGLRVVLFGLLALNVLCLYYTFVRTALTGFAAFVALFFALERRWRLLALAGVAGVGLLLVNESLQDRFRDVVEVFSADTDSKRTLGSGRWGIWSTSIREYLSRTPVDIVFGLGLGGQYELTDAYQDLYRSTKKSENLDSHNDYLTLLYQLGPIAVVSYVAMQVEVIRRGLELSRWGGNSFDGRIGRYGIAMCGVVFVTNSLSNSFINRITIAWLFWGVVGVLFAVHRAVRERQAAEQQAKG